MKIWLLILSVLLPFGANVFAQSYTFRTYSVPEGLPHSNITSLSQDEDGFLWVGTMLGIAKFDGLNFKIYTYENGLPNNHVSSSFYDKNNRLWLGHNDGRVSYYDAVADSFIIFDKIKSSKAIYRIKPSRSGGLFFITQGDGIYYWNDDQVFPIHENYELPSAICRDVLESRNGNLYIATRKGLAIYEKFVPGEPKLLKIIQIPDGKISRSTSRLIETDDGSIWLGLQSGAVVRYLGLNHPSGRMFDVHQKKYSINGDWVTDMYQASDGAIWVGHFIFGLVKITKQPTTAGQYDFEYIAEKKGLPSKRISCILQGREGNMWFGTRGGGLIQFKDERFVTYNTSDGLVDDYVLSTLQDYENDIWVGSRYGITKISPDAADKKVLRFSSHHHFKLENIFAAYQDVDSILWFSAYGSGLVRYDKSKNNMRTIGLKDGLPNIHIKHIVGDKDSSLFLGTSAAGLIVYNRYSEKFKVLKDWKPAKKTRIYDIQVCESGTQWIATNNGLFTYNGKKLNRSWISDSLKGQTVIKVDQESNGVLWLLLDSGKLARIEMGKIQTISPPEDLEGNVITAFLVDVKNQIWVETTRSIGKFVYETGEFNILNKLAGFPVNHVNIKSLYDDKYGRIWVGSREGLICYDEKKKHKRLVSHRTKILNLQVFLKDQPINDNVSLKSGQNHLTFYYQAISFSLPEFMIYRYKLEGLDNDWLPETREKFATYSNLPPGDYEFLVQSRQQGSDWSGDTAKMKVRIKAPFWRRWYFYLLVIILILGSIYTYIRQRHYRIEREKRRLQKRVEAQTEALRQEKERLDAIIENMDEAVILTDAKGRILFLNETAESLTGNKLEMVFGKSLNTELHLYDVKTDQRIADIMLNLDAVSEKTHYLKDYILKSGDDRQHTISYSGTYLRDRQDTITGAVLVLRDETEKRKLEQEFLKSTKIESIGILAGGIAHDFNNILTGIMGNISLARLYEGDEGELEQRLNDAENATVRAKDLTQQLLTFSKGGAPIKQTTSIVSVIQDSINFIMSGSSVQTKLKYPKNLWAVTADPGQISQVLQNLLLNAEQAMPSGGNILVTVENVLFEDESSIGLLGKYVKISVNDEGIGISEEHLNQIFDPYFTTKKHGNGLGLATAFSIVKKHGGHIEVNSQLGKGTQICFYLQAVNEAPKLSAAEKSGILGGSGRILLMDDEAVVRDISVKMLKQLGYSADTSEDGSDFLKKYQQKMDAGEPYDLVILDLTVPGAMGGKEAMENLLRIHPEALAIVSSGYSSDPVMANYKEYGFAGMASKPYSIKELGKTLKDVLSRP